MLRQPLGEFVRLRPRDGLQGTFVQFVIPDGGVIAALARGANRQNDEVQDWPPFPLGLFDNPLVGKEFLQVAPHRPIGGGIRRPEVQKENADPAELDRGMTFGQVGNVGARRIGLEHWVPWIDLGRTRYESRSVSDCRGQSGGMRPIAPRRGRRGVILRSFR